MTHTSPPDTRLRVTHPTSLPQLAARVDVTGYGCLPRGTGSVADMAAAVNEKSWMIASTPAASQALANPTFVARVQHLLGAVPPPSQLGRALAASTETAPDLSVHDAGTVAFDLLREGGLLDVDQYLLAAATAGPRLTERLEASGFHVETVPLAAAKPQVSSQSIS